MSEVSVTEAKNNLPRLIHEAEDGNIVRITRRGRRVAVLVSERDFERLSRPRASFSEFLREWRRDMDADRVEYPIDEDFEGLRDNTPRQPVTWE